MEVHLRIARPVSNLEKSVQMYCRGFGLVEVGRFADHQGFDGVMLGRVGASYHFEFTFCRGHPVIPAPTPEDLIVFYLPDTLEWENMCQSALVTGFVEVKSFNPYWDKLGRTFEDHDRYRVVLQRAAWSNIGSL
jgi:catechol 2,3-dioxygenase-like lactoylglutathione lyase family enzyme